MLTQITGAAANGSPTFNAAPQQWIPEEPKLYDAQLSCGTDQEWDRIGFREIRVEGMDSLLNGKALTDIEKASRGIGLPSL